MKFMNNFNVTTLHLFSSSEQKKAIDFVSLYKATPRGNFQISNTIYLKTIFQLTLTLSILPLLAGSWRPEHKMRIP